MKFNVVLLLFLLLMMSLNVSAQENQQMVSIELTDGSELIGQLISINELEVVFQNQELGLLTFKRENIKRIVYLNDKSWRQNPNPTRYFIGQSAFNLPKGEGYYQNIYGLVNIFGYGISEHLSVMGGVELLTLFSGSPAFLTNLKYGRELSKNLRVAGSVTYLLGIGEITRDLSLGIINALVTYGNQENNITVGSGFAFAEDQFTNTGVLTLGGMKRLSKRFAFISENYILTSGEEAIYSGGFRLINKRSTVDLLVTRGFFPLLDIVFTF